LWKSRGRGNRFIKIKLAGRKVPWRLVLYIRKMCFIDKNCMLLCSVIIQVKTGDPCMMATPMLECVCCMRFGYSGSCPREPDYYNVNLSYNVLAMLSALLSICGVVYQLRPRVSRPDCPEPESVLQLSIILHYLALADLLASVGLFQHVLMNLLNFLALLFILCVHDFCLLQ